MKENFSYSEYYNIIDNIKKVGEIRDFKEINSSTSNFIIIRHDVEFSVEKAYEMAILEKEKCNITSSYFFQLRNNSYNILSKQNINMIRKLYSMGHSIGLHVHLGALKHIDNIEEYIIKDVETLQNYLSLPIDRFSFHRPSKQVLAINLKIQGLINAYSDEYFHYIDNIENYDDLRVKYFSDSMNTWQYGYPDKTNLQNNKRIQILMHPYSWSKNGYSSDENFEILIREKTDVLRNTIRMECKHYNK
ncbi:MAG: hypothetical protein N4A57_13615 [Anaeromicrobium sp.]|jgi:hypothetical protein|uniref:hypothetical protein n=1 Tax=Anaeromicrobium sp. TaxID=1929132 RepID=UPI0025CF568C|nr:hypothetical protein [Anaeromicrobium sp.]MCT4595282.1 hypothetical protein [Anaeromicrobium sp.]